MRTCSLMSLTESVVCLDWGEGSGLEVWDSECNTAYPGKANIDIHIGKSIDK